MLQNPVSFIGYFIVLWRFFYRRIFCEYADASESCDHYLILIDEEKALVKFFEADYQAYKARVPTRIPFIR